MVNNMKTKTFKNNCIFTGILAIQYLVCGSVYISQMYHLYSFFSGDMVTIIALRWNYFAQAFGMLVFILLFLKTPKLIGNRITYALSIVIGTMVFIISLLSNNGPIAVTFTIAFNVLIGLYSGYTLTLLSSRIHKRKLGIAFASAYSFGSIGTYVISVMGNGDFLQSKNIIYLYVLINIIHLISLYFAKNISDDEIPKHSTKPLIKYNKDKLQTYLFILILLILVNAISSLGNNFQFSEIIEGEANLPFSRAFYALGLLSAGIISLKNRKYVLFSTLVCLLYPVVAVVLAGNTSFASALLTISYLFLGFVSVYRSLSTMDIAAEKNHLLAFACSGLMISRLVEAASTWFSNVIITSKLLAAILFCILFALLLIIFFVYIQTTYKPSTTYKSGMEDRYLEFAQTYNLTPREKEILQLLIKGFSNRDIAQSMYITENTVKFHIKHILKKTDCLNRAELATLYKKNEIMYYNN